MKLRDGTTLWTRSAGDPDQPGLVLLHGGPGLWDYLEPAAALAAGLFRTHRYDQRACGRSTGGGELTMDRWVADLDELRALLGCERWFVFGHSFGATLGLRYAAAHPDRVAGLLYCSGVGIGWPRHRPEFARRAAARLTPAQLARRTELDAADRSWAEELEWRTLSWLPDFVDPTAAAGFVAASDHLRINHDCSRALNAEMASWTPAAERAVCAAVEAPVLLAHGTADPRPVDGVRELAACLPDATLVEIEGTAHHPWHERSDTVRALLSQLRGRG